MEGGVEGLIDKWQLSRALKMRQRRERRRSVRRDQALNGR